MHPWSGNVIIPFLREIHAQVIKDGIHISRIVRHFRVVLSELEERRGIGKGLYEPHAMWSNPNFLRSEIPPYV